MENAGIFCDHFFPFWYVWTKKNLATLPKWVKMITVGEIIQSTFLEEILFRRKKMLSVNKNKTSSFMTKAR
jgi:hypothetical protein